MHQMGTYCMLLLLDGAWFNETQWKRGQLPPPDTTCSAPRVGCPSPHWSYFNIIFDLGDLLQVSSRSKSTLWCQTQ
jgi:hypothetical protein